MLPLTKIRTRVSNRKETYFQLESQSFDRTMRVNRSQFLFRSIMLKPSTAFLFCATILALSFNASAADLALEPITGGTFRFKDCNGRTFGDAYIQSYTYSNAQVTVALDDHPGQAYLSGLITATGLKPNFAYQIKLGGRNSKLSPAGTGDDATNERLGLIGRWWRQYPNPANSNDSDYMLT